MLVVEAIARIRREHFIKGRTIKKIVRDLKVSRNTVLRAGETSFEHERLVQPRPKLGRWAAELDGLLAATAAKSAREQLMLIRTFEELLRRRLSSGGPIFLIGAACNDLQDTIKQRPLQRLGFVPRRTHPYVALFVGR
jgi:hypothetical protein